MNEFYFNHAEIYTLLFNGNIQSAIEVFTNKTKAVEFTPLTRTSYLSSLNYGIYNYILLKENLSLHNCCMENEKKISRVTTDSVVSTGINIITAYGFDERYLIEKYHNVHIKNALYYIHTHLNEPMSLKLVSTAINVSPSYLCQLFRKETDTSFCDYILNRRIKLAQGLLKKTNRPIQDIADQCGFKSAAYFSTCYKKETGHLPSDDR